MTTRDERQRRIHVDWREAGGRNTVEACTGFGKTRVAVNVIKSMNENLPMATCDVVVPSIHLKKDWSKENGHIVSNRLKNVEVFTIHTYIKANRDPTLLVIDEIHNMGAETFSQIFTMADYKYLLGLTATLERTDGRHELIQKYAPICATVTLEEAVANKWVSDYEVYNIGVDLSDEDRLREVEINDAFNNYFAKLESDFDLANACRGSMKPQWNKEKGWYEPAQVSFARRKGWHGNSLQQAIAINSRNKSLGEKVKPWGGNREFEFSPEKISEYAQKWGFYMNERQEFLHDATNKKSKAIEIIEKFRDKKIIVFTERKATCDDLTERLKKKGILCESYHSEVKTEIYCLGKLVALGEMVGTTTKYRDLETDKLLSLDNIKLKFGKVVRLGKERLKERRAKDFEDGKFNVLVTVKALDEGFNVGDIDISLTVAGKSVTRQNDQRNGRALRFVEGKIAWMINLYVIGTKDYYWTKARQEKSKPPHWIDDINEIGKTKEKISIW